MIRATQYMLLALVIVASLFLPGCNREDHTGSKKLQVVTTLFPLYDFARIIAGDRADISMLLPPGMEPHSFEPKPNDIVRVNKSGLFIYTNRYMEPWAESILKGVDRQRLKVVDAGQGVGYANSSPSDGHDHQTHNDRGVELHAGGIDPHIWLDFANAEIMVNNILAGFVVSDPANAPVYKQNATTLKTALVELDRRYRDALASCATRTFLHGGHFTFGYLARRYGLEYHSLSGVSSESEPSAAKMAAMVRQIKSSGVHYLFAEELLSPRLSNTLANESGVAVLMLHGAHNLGRDDMSRGIGFIELMEQNLKNLQKGLECTRK
jgi:zinc transport system substrate-binding protein